MIVGFGFRARQGKDTAAWAIHRAYPELTRVYSFAAALKAHCRIAHGMTAKDPGLLQRIGVEARAANPRIWLDAVLWQIAEDDPPVALIADCRFENEAAACDLTVRVERYRPDGSPFVAPDRDASHASETGLVAWPSWSAWLKAPDGAPGVLARRAVEWFSRVVLPDVRPA